MGEDLSIDFFCGRAQKHVDRGILLFSPLNFFGPQQNIPSLNLLLYVRYRIEEGVWAHEVRLQKFSLEKRGAQTWVRGHWGAPAWFLDRRSAPP